MRNLKNKKFSRLDRLLDIPEEVISTVPKFTITGFEEMLIENYKGILEYEEYYIKLNTYRGIVNINGFHLKLEQMTEDDILVKGKIESIDFEEETDEE